MKLQSRLLDLPDELISHIFKDVDLLDALTLKCVCRTLAGHINTSKFLAEEESLVMYQGSGSKHIKFAYNMLDIVQHLRANVERVQMSLVMQGYNITWMNGIVFNIVLDKLFGACTFSITVPRDAQEAAFLFVQGSVDEHQQILLDQTSIGDTPNAPTNAYLVPAFLLFVGCRLLMEFHPEHIETRSLPCMPSWLDKAIFSKSFPGTLWKDLVYGRIQLNFSSA